MSSIKICNFILLKTLRVNYLKNCKLTKVLKLCFHAAEQNYPLLKCQIFKAFFVRLLKPGHLPKSVASVNRFGLLFCQKISHQKFP